MTMLSGRFLQVVEVLFDEAIVAAVFRPAVADFEAELRDAGESRAKALLLRCRWSGALAVLVAVTTMSVARPSRLPRARPVDGGGSILFLYAPLIAGAWWCVQLFAGAALVGGVVLACALHAWNLRHSAAVGLSIDPLGRTVPGPLLVSPIAEASPLASAGNISFH
jgi:hypothetical protein